MKKFLMVLLAAFVLAGLVPAGAKAANHALKIPYMASAYDLDSDEAYFVNRYITQKDYVSAKKRMDGAAFSATVYAPEASLDESGEGIDIYLYAGIKSGDEYKGNVYGTYTIKIFYGKNGPVAHAYSPEKNMNKVSDKIANNICTITKGTGAQAGYYKIVLKNIKAQANAYGTPDADAYAVGTGKYRLSPACSVSFGTEEPYADVFYVDNIKVTRNKKTLSKMTFEGSNPLKGITIENAEEFISPDVYSAEVF